MADDAATTLYNADFYLWTQAQAAALRARAGADNQLDYDHLAEEIEDLGKSDYRAVASAVRLILEHLYKLHATQRQEPLGHWAGEIETFRLEIGQRLTATLERLVRADLERLHEQAAKVAARKFAFAEPEAAIDPSLRWTWEEILGETDDPLDQPFPRVRPLAGD